MIISTIEIQIPNTEDVTVTEDTLTAELSDGRTISVPLAWHPRLVHATQEERDNWELLGDGQGIRWPDLDEGHQHRGADCRPSLRRESTLFQALA